MGMNVGKILTTAAEGIVKQGEKAVKKEAEQGERKIAEEIFSKASAETQKAYHSALSSLQKAGEAAKSGREVWNTVTQSFGDAKKALSEAQTNLQTLSSRESGLRGECGVLESKIKELKTCIEELEAKKASGDDMFSSAKRFFSGSAKTERTRVLEDLTRKKQELAQTERELTSNKCELNDVISKKAEAQKACDDAGKKVSDLSEKETAAQSELRAKDSDVSVKTLQAGILRARSACEEMKEAANDGVQALKRIKERMSLGISFEHPDQKADLDIIKKAFEKEKEAERLANETKKLGDELYYGRTVSQSNFRYYQDEYMSQLPRDSKFYLEQIEEQSKRWLEEFKKEVPDSIKNTDNYKKALELMENPTLKADLNSSIPIERIAARSQEHTEEEIAEIIDKYGCESKYMDNFSWGGRIESKVAFGTRQPDGTIKFLNPKDGSISEQLQKLRDSGSKDSIITFAANETNHGTRGCVIKNEIFPESQSCIHSRSGREGISSELIQEKEFDDLGVRVRKRSYEGGCFTVCHDGHTPFAVMPDGISREPSEAYHHLYLTLSNVDQLLNFCKRRGL